jgi:hypothetical protein
VAGYTGTPLAKKLSLKDGMRVWFDAMPESVCDEIAMPVLLYLAKPKAGIDAAHLFVTDRTDMEAKLAILRPLLQLAIDRPC